MTQNDLQMGLVFTYKETIRRTTWSGDVGQETRPLFRGQETEVKQEKMKKLYCVRPNSAVPGPQETIGQTVGGQTISDSEDLHDHAQIKLP